MPALPSGWLKHDWVEIVSIVKEEDGTERITTSPIDETRLFDWIKKTQHSSMTPSQYRDAVRRMCLDFGAGYRKSQLRDDVRDHLAKRIRELGRKHWACVRSPKRPKSTTQGKSKHSSRSAATNAAITLGGSSTPPDVVAPLGMTLSSGLSPSELGSFAQQTPAIQAQTIDRFQQQPSLQQHQQKSSVQQPTLYQFVPLVQAMSNVTPQTFVHHLQQYHHMLPQHHSQQQQQQEKGRIQTDGGGDAIGFSAGLESMDDFRSLFVRLSSSLNANMGTSTSTSSQSTQQLLNQMVQPQLQQLQQQLEVQQQVPNPEAQACLRISCN